MDADDHCVQTHDHLRRTTDNLSVLLVCNVSPKTKETLIPHLLNNLFELLEKIHCTLVVLPCERLSMTNLISDATITRRDSFKKNQQHVMPQNVIIYSLTRSLAFRVQRE